MNQALSFNTSVSINASADAVWETLTNPAKIKQWLFGTEIITDWMPGSELIFQGEYNGMKYRDKGIIVENLKGKLLSYKYWSGFSGLEDKPENYSLVAFSLEQSNDGIKLSLTQTGFANEDAHKHSAANWEAVLIKLKETALI